MIINFYNFVNESVDNKTFIPKDIFKKYKLNKYQLYKMNGEKNRKKREELSITYSDNIEKATKDIQLLVVNKIVKFYERKKDLCQTRVNSIFIGNNLLIFMKDQQESNIEKIMRWHPTDADDVYKPEKYWWSVDINKPVEIINIDKFMDPYEEENWELTESNFSFDEFEDGEIATYVGNKSDMIGKDIKIVTISSRPNTARVSFVDHSKYPGVFDCNFLYLKKKIIQQHPKQNRIRWYNHGKLVNEAVGDKIITVPNLEKFKGEIRNDYNTNRIQKLQKKFNDRIQVQYVKIRTKWDEIIEGRVDHVIFHIHSNGVGDIITNVTVKIYMMNGKDYNVKQNGKIYIIQPPPPRVRWYNHGKLVNEAWDDDIDVYNNRNKSVKPYHGGCIGCVNDFPICIGCRYYNFKAVSNLPDLKINSRGENREQERRIRLREQEIRREIKIKKERERLDKLPRIKHIEDPYDEEIWEQ